MINKFLKFLSSPGLALACILAALGLVALALFPLQFLKLPGDRIVHLAARGMPFLIVYSLLALSALACFRKRWKALPKLVKSAPRLPQMDTGVMSDVPFDGARAAGALRRVGFRKIFAEDDRVIGVKSPFSPAGNHLLHTAILLAIVATMLALIPGVAIQGRARVVEGGRFNGRSIKLPDIMSPGSRRIGLAFSVKDVKATSVGQRPSTLAVTVRTASGATRRISPGWPWFPDGITMVAAEDFGLTARVSILPSGTVTPIATRTLDLTYHGFDSPQSYVIKASTGKLYRVDVKSQARPKVSDAPVPLTVTLSRYDGATRGWRRLGAPTKITRGGILRGGGVHLRLDDTRPHAVLRLQRSPIAPIVLLALLCATIGSFLRLVTPRTEAVLEARDDGRTSIRAATDVHRTANHLQHRLMKAFERNQ